MSNNPINRIDAKMFELGLKLGYGKPVRPEMQNPDIARRVRSCHGFLATAEEQLAELERMAALPSGGRP